MKHKLTVLLAFVFTLTLNACGSGSGGAGATLRANPTASGVASSDAPNVLDAGRFLAQSTMGAGPADIDAVQTIGIPAWFDDQVDNQPQTLARPYVERIAANRNVAYTGTNLQNVQFDALWWRAGTGTDLLRQRVSWALSQIFVISAAVDADNQMPRSMADYLDTLSRDSFGNFRTLLQDVTLHPAMGVYLNMLGNQDPNPNQNYARELMQLFTVGLVQLNPDGTPVMSNGKTVPTFGQADVVGLSHVFTGFSWGSSNPNWDSWRGGPYNNDADVLPMSAYNIVVINGTPNVFHSTVRKDFLGVTIPASSTPDAMGDLSIALDTLYNHPNIGPFIGKQLIQHLVTSNPSPAYIQRVSNAFNSGSFSFGGWKTGTGVRGDLRATIAAILLDSEARDPSFSDNPGFGRIREPLLRVTTWMRAFSAVSPSGNFSLGDTSSATAGIGMSPLDSPSVFNYYSPSFSPSSSALSGSNLVAPELQLSTTSTTVGYANFIRWLVSSQGWPSQDPDVMANYDYEVSIANSPVSLVSWLNQLLTYGTLSTQTQSLVIEALNAITGPIMDPASGQSFSVNQQRVWVAVTMVLSAPEFITQR
jgi:uncharacterized protein (DUF1800 family)